MKTSWKSFLLRHEIILLLVVILEWLYFNSVGRRFATLDNSFDIIRHSVEVGLLALVMTPVILTGGIDLSVGSTLGLCAIVFGQLWHDAGLNPMLAAFGAITVGGIAGGVNAVLISQLRLPPLIVTLGTFSLYRGLAEAITQGTKTYTGFPESFLRIGQQLTAGVPTQMWIFGAIAVVVWILVHRTTFGRSLRAIGFAPEGARYAGLPVERQIASAYLLTGIVAGIAGVIYTARLGQAKADAGTGYELVAITAVVLGGTSIFGGIGTIHGTLLGVAAIAILNNGLVHARQPREMAGILTGALLIVALAASATARRLRTAGEKQKPVSESLPPSPAAASPEPPASAPRD